VADEVSKLYDTQLGYMDYYMCDRPMSEGAANTSTMLLADTLLDLAQAKGFTPVNFPSL
jgi:hypothetical protein